MNKYSNEFYDGNFYLTTYPKKWYTLDEAIEEFMSENKDEFEGRDIEYDKRFLVTGEGYVHYGYYHNEDTGERQRGYYITIEKKKTYQDCWCVCFKTDRQAVDFLEESKKWRDENEHNNITD